MSFRAPRLPTKEEIAKQNRAFYRVYIPYVALFFGVCAVTVYYNPPLPPGTKHWTEEFEEQLAKSKAADQEMRAEFMRQRREAAAKKSSSSSSSN